MIKIENVEILGWDHAIHGMRNPMNSWEKSDSGYCHRDFLRDCKTCVHGPSLDNCWRKGYDIGPNDLDLMKRLANGGPVHAKYRRMITVYCDIFAPLYWWKEFDTYKVGTVSNSCSTMHKIHTKEFTLEDFSHEHLINSPLVEEKPGVPERLNMQAQDMLMVIIGVLNAARFNYLKTKDKKYWWQMIQLLPSSYNQRRTVMLNYEVLANIYHYRKDHKLDEWRDFCQWITTLPYSQIITGEVPTNVN